MPLFTPQCSNTLLYTSIWWLIHHKWLQQSVLADVFVYSRKAEEECGCSNQEGRCRRDRHVATRPERSGWNGGVGWGSGSRHAPTHAAARHHPGGRMAARPAKLSVCECVCVETAQMKKERLREKLLSFWHYRKRPQDEHCFKSTKQKYSKERIWRK